MFGEFCLHPKFAKHEKPNRNPGITALASGLASLPAGRQAWSEAGATAKLHGANTTNAARPSGRCISSLNFKERKKNIVKPKQKANLMRIIGQSSPLSLL